MSAGLLCCPICGSGISPNEIESHYIQVRFKVEHNTLLFGQMYSLFLCFFSVREIEKREQLCTNNDIFGFNQICY